VTVLLTAANLASVKHYGELEFWFALVKVVAISPFVMLGLFALAGGLPNVHLHPLENLTERGGFLPRGLSPVVGALLTTMFTFLGTEVVTIAAAESENPAKEIARAITSVVWRISLFYIGSIVVIISAVSWNDSSLIRVGSYQAVLEVFHVPHAKLMIDLLILIAVASCLNSALYTASRMLFSHGTCGQAPALVTLTTKAGVPANAVIGSTLVAFAGCAANYIAPKYVFDTLLSTTGAIALLVYFIIALSQLLLRARLVREGTLKVRMWAHPWLSTLTLFLILAAFVVMVRAPDHRQEVAATLGASVVLALFGVFSQRRRVQRA
jgi:AAT family amino acid transporter/GABA permease